MNTMPSEKASKIRKAVAKKDDHTANGQVQAQKVVDPVCGMKISPDEGLAYTYKDTRYYFCSEYDMVKFKKNPEKYAMQDHAR
jgi:YHS domain-containing protein